MTLLPLFALLALTLGAAPQPPAAQSIDTQRSRITVYVYKRGLFSFLADNHTIAAPIARGACDAQRKTVSLAVDAAKMRVLDPALPPDKRASVQANMLGPQVLDANRYPAIAFQSIKIEGSGKGAWTVTGGLELHGRTRTMTFPVESDGAGHFTGSVMVRQTAFGMTPVRIAGGTVSVKDDVRIAFDIWCR
ncbi:MAG: YceI family protein [Candidatus Baltobacteraceae bacterium]